jgi:hypothetical protein
MKLKKTYLIFVVLTISLYSEEYFIYNDLDFQLNNLGIATSLIAYKQNEIKYEKKSILLNGCNYKIGLIDQFTPTDNLLGVYFRFKPLAIFDCKAQIGHYYIFKNIGEKLNFKSLGHRKLPRQESNYESDSLLNHKSENKNGLWLQIKPSFQIKNKCVAFKHSLTIDIFKIYTNDEYYYNQQTSSIFQNQNLSLANTTFLYFCPNDLNYIGIFHYLLKVNDVPVVKKRAGLVYLFNKTNSNNNYDFYYTILCGLSYKDRIYQNKFYLALSVGCAFRLFQYAKYQ